MLISESLNLHIYLIYAIFSFLVIDFIMVFINSEKSLKVIKWIAPTLYFLISSIFFTGLLLMVLKQEFFSIHILLMFATLLFTFIMEIKRHKLQKRGDEKLVSFAKKSYFSSIIAILFTTFL